MIVDRLPLIVIRDALQPWPGSDGLRCFVSFEAPKQLLLARSPL
jgi:hypothetical protein